LCVEVEWEGAGGVERSEGLGGSLRAALGEYWEGTGRRIEWDSEWVSENANEYKKQDGATKSDECGW